MLTLNVVDVARKAKDTYLAKGLSAQNGSPSCRYRDALGFPCAIGPSLSDETAKNWDAHAPSSEIRSMCRFLETDNICGLAAIQNAHDRWAARSSPDTNEREFVEVLNRYLPVDEQIELPPKAYAIFE